MPYLTIPLFCKAPPPFPLYRSLPTRTDPALAAVVGVAAVVVELLVAGPVRCTQAEACVRDWLSQHSNNIVMLEHDTEHDGIDTMASKCGDLYQYAVDEE
jgi:hypothetical protein